MTLWIVFLAYIEAFGAGVAIFAKRRGRKEWAYYFIPFYAFTFANKTTKGFKVMSIPVENLFKSVLVETAVCILAFIYAKWGATHLGEIDAPCLKQIMWVPAGTALIVFYLGNVKSSLAVFEEWRCRFPCDWILYLTLIALPVAYAMLPVREKRNNAVGL